MKIVYSVFNRGVAGVPREIKIPRPNQLFGYYDRSVDVKLREFVNKLGQLLGARKYCMECFSHSSIALLEIHDYSGCVEKII